MNMPDYGLGKRAALLSRPLAHSVRCTRMRCMDADAFVTCCSAALQFVVANSDAIDAFAEFKDRSKPLFILYKKGAKLTVCTRRGKSWA